MYKFGEKKTEWSSKQGTEIPVIITKKYEQSKKKAIEIIEKYEDITEADFWILMNETKNKNMMYNGLIISHNGCLKLNDHLPKADRFKPESVTCDKEGYAGSLIFSYINPEQGLYEVGEASQANCKNAYPYAMALKRCFDRVVLKQTKLAYSGIYSEVEADDFKQKLYERTQEEVKAEVLERATWKNKVLELGHKKGISSQEIAEDYGLSKNTSVERLKEVYADLEGTLQAIQNDDAGDRI